MPTGPKESSITASIVRKLKAVLPHAFVWKIHGGAYSSGMPDLGCVISGRSVFFEVKRPGKKPTPLQAARIKDLQAAGAVAEVVTSPGEVLAILVREKIIAEPEGSHGV